MLESLPGLDRLGSRVTCEENGRKKEVSTVRGYRAIGDTEKMGVFTLIHEVINNSSGELVERYILTHDTPSDPMIRGVILQDERVVSYVGFDQDPTEEAVRELFIAFDTCPKYRYPS